MFWLKRLVCFVKPVPAARWPRPIKETTHARSVESLFNNGRDVVEEIVRAFQQTTSRLEGRVERKRKHCLAFYRPGY